MDKKDIEFLEKEKIQRIDNAAKLLAEDKNLVEVRKEIEWAETANRLLSSTHKVKFFKSVVIMMIVCFIAIGIVFSVNIMQTSFAFDITAKNINWTFLDQWSWPHLADTKQIDIKKGPAKILLEKQPSELDHINADQISMHDFLFSKNSRIETGCDKKKITLYISDSEFDGSLSITNRVDPIKQTISDKNKMNSEIMDIKMEDVSKDRLVLGFIPSDNLEISIAQKSKNSPPVPIDNISFTKEDPPASGFFSSTIQSGKLVVMETHHIYNLQKNDNMVFKHLKIKKFYITQQDDSLLIHIIGSAKHIFLGPMNFETDISPSILEYIYYNQKIQLYWVAFILVFSILYKGYQRFLS